MSKASGSELYAQLEAAGYIELTLPSGPLRLTAEEIQVRLQAKPDYAAARFNYGIALARSGDLAGAIPHLRKAAESPDQPLRERALQVLQQLGQRN